MHPITHDLRALKAHDPSYRVFGARIHRYQMNPIAPAALRELEHVLGVQLPHVYRQHLLTHGAGAGPYYGLWDSTMLLAEWLDWRDDYQQETGVRASPARPFPFTTTDAVMVGRSAVDTPTPRSVATTWPCDGCIPIGDQGCTYWSVLVTCGDLIGTVWDLGVLTGFDGGFRPAARPPGIVEPGLRPRALPLLNLPPSFDAWYQGWMAQALADLQPP
jgi:hypothetical protein